MSNEPSFGKACSSSIQDQWIRCRHRLACVDFLTGAPRFYKPQSNASQARFHLKYCGIHGWRFCRYGRSSSFNEDSSTPREGDVISAVSVAPYTSEGMTRDTAIASSKTSRLPNTVPYPEIEGVYSFSDNDSAAPSASYAPSSTRLYPQVEGFSVHVQPSQKSGQGVNPSAYKTETRPRP